MAPPSQSPLCSQPEPVLVPPCDPRAKTAAIKREVAQAFHCYISCRERERKAIMVVVTFSNVGVQLTKTGGTHQQICLAYHEWGRLAASANDGLDRFMSGATLDPDVKADGRVWSLAAESTSGPGSSDCRAVASIFQDRRYVNIRVYVDAVATKQGVTLNLAEWRSLKSALGGDDDTRLARIAYKELLKERLEKFRPAVCDGCRTSHLSQTQHLCVMEPGRFYDGLLAKVPYLPGPHLIERLAMLAKKQSVLLRRSPVDLFNVMCYYYRPGIEKELRQQFVGHRKVGPQAYACDGPYRGEADDDGEDTVELMG